MKHEEYILLTLLFLLGLSLWTLPIRENPLPFGEGDSAWHFANCDAIAQDDQTFWRLPSYIGNWYYNFNKILGPNALEYPPAWHVNCALYPVVGGQRVVPIFIFMAIASFIGAFTIYFFLRKLYGIEAAFIAALGVLFSYRSIMVYLWGQRPSITAFIFTPLILYSFYKFITGVYKQEPKYIYLYISVLLFAGQFLIHAMGSIHSFLIIIFSLVFFLIKYKTLPVSKAALKHYGICILLLALITGPFFVVYLGGETGALSGGISHSERLLYWFNVDKLEGYPNIGGAPLTYYDTSKNYFIGYFVFVIIGVIYLLYKREDRDLIMLGWLAGSYIAYHLDVLGILPFGRTSRFLISETMLFYALIGIGIFSFIQLIKNNIFRNIIKGTAIAVLLMVLFMNYNSAHEILKNAYNSPTIRITENQYNTAEWIKNNIPHNSQFYYIGQLTYPKQRFMYVLSRSFGMWQQDNADKEWFKPEYALVEFTDFDQLPAEQSLSALYFINDWEKMLTTEHKIFYIFDGEKRYYNIDGNVTAIYNGNGVNIYKIDWNN